MTAAHVVTERLAGELIELLSPSPGLFHPGLTIGDLVRAGTVLGALEVLGQTFDLVASDTVRGSVIALRNPALARSAVDFGAVLVTLDPRGGVVDRSATSVVVAAAAVTGLVFRAPTSGRFYGRSAPDKPPFVSAGAELAIGATVCLLEVMKTFHRVTYGGTGLPERARVRELLVADGSDVNAGEPLLALEAV